MPGLKAGRHAAARLAYLEAIAHLERGLGLLHSLPESPARDGSEVELQLARVSSFDRRNPMRAPVFSNPSPGDESDIQPIEGTSL
jgi:hypothetical protein